MSGSELAKAKELAAQKMREKQAAGMRPSDLRSCVLRFSPGHPSRYLFSVSHRH
jgi:hypothetical protein